MAVSEVSRLLFAERVCAAQSKQQVFCPKLAAGKQLSAGCSPLLEPACVFAQQQQPLSVIICTLSEPAVCCTGLTNLVNMRGTHHWHLQAYAFRRADHAA